MLLGVIVGVIVGAHVSRCSPQLLFRISNKQCAPLCNICLCICDSSSMPVDLFLKTFKPDIFFEIFKPDTHIIVSMLLYNCPHVSEQPASATAKLLHAWDGVTNAWQ